MSRGGGTTSNVALASVDSFLHTLYRQQLLGTQMRHLYVLVHTVRKNTYACKSCDVYQTEPLGCCLQRVHYTRWFQEHASFNSVNNSEFEEFQVMQQHQKHEVSTDNGLQRDFWISIPAVYKI